MDPRFDLPPAKKEAFEVTWPLYQELAEQLRHFNTLQSHYRTMSSTWLLAAIGGIGFIYTNAATLPFKSDGAAAIVATAAAVGISLLWVLDVLVYHQLLIANDEALGDLEAQHEWLPRVRSIGSQLRVGRSVRENISLFYIGSVLLLMLIAAVAIERFVATHFCSCMAWIAFVLVIGFACVWGRAMYTAALLRLAKKEKRRASPAAGSV